MEVAKLDRTVIYYKAHCHNRHFFFFFINFFMFFFFCFCFCFFCCFFLEKKINIFLLDVLSSVRTIDISFLLARSAWSAHENVSFRETGWLLHFVLFFLFFFCEFFFVVFLFGFFFCLFFVFFVIFFVVCLFVFLNNFAKLPVQTPQGWHLHTFHFASLPLPTPSPPKKKPPSDIQGVRRPYKNKFKCFLYW